MRRPRAAKLAATVSALALVAVACGGDENGEGNGGGNGGSGGAPEAQVVTTNISNPQNPLLPAHTPEVEGATLLRLVYNGLVSYDPETGDTHMEVAESVESEDNLTWEITLKEGLEFTNGEPVDADAFVRGWNYGSYGPNAQATADFFERVAGYEDMQGEEPEAEELSGMEKTGDYSFTVTLNEPFSSFDTSLGYTAYYPMAQECLDDIEACGARPIGNGPMMFEGDYVADEGVTLVRNEDYAGETPAQLEVLRFRWAEDLATVYNLVQGGELDIARGLPPEVRTEAQGIFGERLVETPTSGFTYAGFPDWDEKFEDPRIKQALSMAIDRQLIIDQVLDGGGFPASAFIPPSIPGHRDNACDACVYDVEGAQELLDEAGGWPEGETLRIYFNAGAGHEGWTQAIGNMLRDDLGIPYELEPVEEWGDYLRQLDEQEIDGLYRLGWSMSYPNPEYALKGLYYSTGRSNNGGYERPEFDELLDAADQLPTFDEAVTGYQEAEDYLLEDLPVIPLWYGLTSIAFNDTVENVNYSVPQSNIVWTDITLAE